MKDIQIGYYWVNLGNGKTTIARWDGKQWNHEFGTSTFALIMPESFIGKMRKKLGMKPRPIAFSCNPQCHCTQNPDGTWNINCS
jgi:hypothetical protein